MIRSYGRSTDLNSISGINRKRKSAKVLLLQTQYPCVPTVMQHVPLKVPLSGEQVSRKMRNCLDINVVLYLLQHGYRTFEMEDMPEIVICLFTLVVQLRLL